MDNLEQLARTGYESYAANSDWKNYQGNPMPQWDDLPELIRQHWQAAVKEIFKTHWESLENLK